MPPDSTIITLLMPIEISHFATSFRYDNAQGGSVMRLVGWKNSGNQFATGHQCPHVGNGTKVKHFHMLLNKCVGNTSIIKRNAGPPGQTNYDVVERGARMDRQPNVIQKRTLVFFSHKHPIEKWIIDNSQ